MINILTKIRQLKNKLPQITLTLDQVSQFAHVLVACFIIEHGYKLTGGNPIWWFLGVAAFAAVKEWVWDENLEDAITRGSNLEDFLFWMLGDVVGLIMIQIVRL